jgi:hypothetical protein
MPNIWGDMWHTPSGYRCMNFFICAISPFLLPYSFAYRTMRKVLRVRCIAPEKIVAWYTAPQKIFVLTTWHSSCDMPTFSKLPKGKIYVFLSIFLQDNTKESTFFWDSFNFYKVIKYISPRLHPFSILVSDFTKSIIRVRRDLIDKGGLYIAKTQAYILFAGRPINQRSQDPMKFHIFN